MLSNDLQDNPERRLMGAVILQAVQDLFTPENCLEAERRAALAFLTAPYGSNARDRAIICGNLDVDPDLLRNWVVGVLEGENYNPSVMLRNSNKQNGNAATEREQRKITKAREMWAEHRLAISPECLNARREKANQDRRIWGNQAA